MIEQIGIAVFSMIAIYLVNDRRADVRRWGPVFGLISQPFWLYTTFTHAQWGIFACSFVYTWSWWIGFKHGWLAQGVKP